MEPFRHGGLHLDLQGFTGTVTDQQKFSETKVSSSGGGGYLHQGSGHVQAPTVTSTTTTKHEFWVQLTDGTQHPIQLTGLDIPLGTGQKITLVYGANRTGGTLLALIANHSANRCWYVSGPGALLKLAGDQTLLALVGVVFTALVLSAVTGVIGGALGIAIAGYLIWKWFQAKGALERFLVAGGQFALSKG
jgi:hypothetical protein